MQEWTNILNALPSQTPTIEILMANRNINHNQVQATNANYNQLLLNPATNANLEQVLSQLNNLHNLTPLTQAEEATRTPTQKRNPEPQHEPQTDRNIQNMNTSNLQTSKKDENHISNSYEEEIITCKFCDKPFKQAYTLKCHIREIHYNEKITSLTKN